ncbi:hypothetical protein BH11CYA1_BH11CYA1_09680 [soil metagenome]
MHSRTRLILPLSHSLAPVILKLIVLSSVSVSIVGCSSNTSTIAPPQGGFTKISPRTPGTAGSVGTSAGSSSSTSNLGGINEGEVAAAQNGHQSHVQVTCTLPVKRMLRPDEKGEKHEKFLLQLSNGSTILVAHNVSRAASVPISAGDIVTVHGEYIWNAKGGVIHWTHASDTPRHESGYIDFNGQRYQ